MAITYIETLTDGDLLQLHKNVEAIARTDCALAFVAGSQGRVSLGGRTFKDIAALGDAIEKKAAMPESHMMLLAGKSGLSCHFSIATRDRLSPLLAAPGQSNLTYQFTADEYMTQAFITWGNLTNKHLARLPYKPQIRLESVPALPGTFNLVFPNIEVMCDFESRKRRGLFDIEAKAAELNAAGVKLEQHVS